MKKIMDVGEVSIAYTEKHTSAPYTLFFIHGNSGSSKTWEKQLSDSLLEKYRLIAFDLPGHGDSSHSKHPNSDYSPLKTAEILAKVIIELSEAKPYILVGFSYGTNLIAEMLNYGVSPKGMVMVGMCCMGQYYPMEKVFKLGERPSVFFYNENSHKTVYDFIEQSLFDKTNAEMLTQDYFKTDVQFKPSLMQSAADGKVTDEIAALKKQALPLCVVFGIHDSLVYPDYLDDSNLELWGNKVHAVQQAGHFVQLDKPEEVTRLLVSFANEVFTQIHAEENS